MVIIASSATTMVAVTVADRNDHAPVFEQAQYRETLRENVEEGYPIPQLRATDGDALNAANLRYRFVGRWLRAAAADAFEIDPRSGLISTQRSRGPRAHGVTSWWWRPATRPRARAALRHRACAHNRAGRELLTRPT